MIFAIVAAGGAALALAYATYGRHLTRVFDVDAGQATPAHTQGDGRDFHPARVPVLFGHHFSSIAGAGPIVGPIFATLIFGWLPAVLWIVLGSIFVGGVHDLGSLVVSVKQRAGSIAQVARDELSPLASKLMLTFVWLALVYVLAVFLDLTAATFAPRAGGVEVARRGGGVASASLMFIGLAVALGVTVTRLRVPLGRASLIFVPLLFAAVAAGQRVPLLPGALPDLAGSPTATWSLLLVAYCFVASVAPVWLLLQPRDYLSSFLLYACLGGGLAGIAASAFTGDVGLVYPAFLGFDSDKLGYLFPALFITIACGACSGFHSIVASGTTARQLDRQVDARPVAYGAMLLEGFLALISVATVAVLAAGSDATRAAPPAIFAQGLGRFLSLLGVPPAAGAGFGLLALSTFLLTTLDTATRLGRYILEELLGLAGRGARFLSTAATLAIPLAFSLMTFRDAGGKVVPVWRLVWPVFGATNQLLGALALMVLTVWLRRRGKGAWVTLLPMVFMLSATLLALVQLVRRHGATLIGFIAAALLLLALVLLAEAARWIIAPGRAAGQRA